MHVLRSMSRKEVVITFLIFLLIILLVLAGVYLTAIYALEEQPNRESELPPIITTPTPESSSIIHHPAYHFASKLNLSPHEFLVTYWFISITASVGAFIYWRKKVYAPAHGACNFLNLFTATDLDNGMQIPISIYPKYPTSSTPHSKHHHPGH